MARKTGKKAPRIDTAFRAVPVAVSGSTRSGSSTSVESRLIDRAIGEARNARIRSDIALAQVNSINYRLSKMSIRQVASSVWSANIDSVRAACRSVAINSTIGYRCQEFLVDRIANCLLSHLVVANTKSKSRNRKIEEGWRVWCRSVTPDGMSMRDLVAAVVRELYQAGEAFIYVYEDNDGLKLQLIEAERIQSIDQPQGRNTYLENGIEYDLNMRPLRYHIQTTEPAMMGTPCAASRVEDASNIIHIANKIRGSDVRGWPMVMQAAQTFFNIDDANANELHIIRQTAYWGINVNTKDSAASVAAGITGGLTYQEAADSTGVTRETFDLTPGGVNIGDYDVKVVTADRPGTNYSPLVKNMLRLGCASVTVPYSAATGDTSETNFSTERAASYYYSPSWSSYQDRLETSLVLDVLGRWMLSSGMIDEKYDCRCRRAERPWFDPRAETDAMRGRRELGLDSFADQLAATGKDPEEHIEYLAAERKMLIDKGLESLIIGGVGRSTTSAAEADSDTSAKVVSSSDNSDSGDDGEDNESTESDVDTEDGANEKEADGNSSTDGKDE